ncbi:MAG TPA: SRPBCC family protein [Marmoricola sp.]
MGSYLVSASQVVPGVPAHAFAAVLPTPLPALFDRRFGPIQPIKEVTDQVGEWSTTGQTRTIRLADGGSMREELTEVSAPDAFGYRITDIHGPMRPLVAEVEGRWTFAAEGGGTRVTWSWRLRPANPVGRVLMPVFGWCWRRYAALALERVEQVVAAQPL